MNRHNFIAPVATLAAAMLICAGATGQDFPAKPITLVVPAPAGATVDLVARRYADGMGPALGQWFVFNLVVSFFVAYVAAHTIPSGTVYLEVFRVVGTVAFLAYGTGHIPAAIWMGKPWSVTFKELFDGLLYGLVTAGTFGWLWPR